MIVSFAVVAFHFSWAQLFRILANLIASALYTFADYCR